MKHNNQRREIIEGTIDEGERFKVAIIFAWHRRCFCSYLTARIPKMAAKLWTRSRELKLKAKVNAKVIALELCLVASCLSSCPNSL